MKKMKILIVGMTGGVGGVETFICNLNRYIDHDRFKVDFLVHQKLNLKYERDILSAKGSIYQICGIKENIKQYLLEIFKFYWTHRDYDIVHLNECGASYFIYAFPVIFLPKIKLIVHSHNGNSSNKLMHKFFATFQNQRSNEQWACSDVAAEWMFGKKRVKKYGCTIIHNGIDLRKYQFDEQIRLQVRIKLGINAFTVIGSVARFEAQKNHSKIIGIFEAYHNSNPKSVLILVGDGSDRERIEKVVQERDLLDSVLFLGIRDDIPDLLMAFDIFLLPSLYEGLPFVTVEAQAASLPMLVSNSVSTQIDLTPLIFREDLHSDVTKWQSRINEIVDSKIDRNSAVFQEYLRDAGYDINGVAENVMKRYQNLVM